MCRRKRREPGVTVYLLTNTFDKDNLNNMYIYSVGTTVQQCQEYLQRMLQLKYMSHFQGWCNLHLKDIKDPESWLEYSKLDFIQEELKEYSITESFYDADRVSTIFRMFNHCQPLGCSFEKDVEFKYFVNNLPKEVVDNIEDEIDNFEDNEKNQLLN